MAKKEAGKVLGYFALAIASVFTGNWIYHKACGCGCKCGGPCDCGTGCSC